MKSSKNSLRKLIGKKARRLTFRLAVLSTVVGLGVYAIAQSRNGQSTDLPEASLPASGSQDETVRRTPVPISMIEEGSAVNPAVSPSSSDEGRLFPQQPASGSVYAARQAVDHQENAPGPRATTVVFTESSSPAQGAVAPAPTRPATAPSPSPSPFSHTPTPRTGVAGNSGSPATVPTPPLPVTTSREDAQNLAPPMPTLPAQPATPPAVVPAPAPAPVVPGVVDRTQPAPAPAPAPSQPAPQPVTPRFPPVSPAPPEAVTPSDSFNPGLTAPSSQRQQSPAYQPPTHPSTNPTMPERPPRETLTQPEPAPRFSPESPRVASHAQGLGVPGAVTQEGPQQAQLVIQKIAPQEVQVGQPATFEIRIRNVGQTPAEKVLLQDEVPRGARLADTTPVAVRGADGSILWDLGTIEPSQEKLVTMQLIPELEGEIGSVATVSFQTSASARSIVTRPQLTITHSTAESVLIGEPVVMLITVANEGSGAARRVILEEIVPPGLAHTGGSELEYELGDLAPGEVRELELELIADEAGRVTNTIRARAEGNLLAEDSLDIHITSPQLTLNVVGPSRRYLEREATFEIAISNPGTAPAHNLELVAHLPRGLQFVSTNNAGQYNTEQHAVYWNLEELPAGQVGQVLVTALPVEIGQHRLQIDGQAGLNLQAAQEHAIDVEGLAELIFEVADVADPIEVGSETVYEVRVVNQGSKVSTNIRLVAVLPPELQPLGGEGPTRAVVQGQQVIFEPLARLAPKADTLFQIRVAGGRAGDHRVRVLLASDDMAAVAKEEATRVYSDQ